MRVLIVDDIKILRDCLKIVIERNSDFKVIGCAGDGIEAYEMAVKHKPDVILMDIMMPKGDGIEATRMIKNQLNDTKILILTTLGDEENVMKAMKCGADGYVLKEINGDELILAINSVKSGLRFIHKNAYSIETKTQFIKDKKSDNEIKDYKDRGSVQLTSRECDVVRLVAQGLTNEEISNSLNISVGRVRNIVTETISKLMLKNRTQLAIYAVKNLLDN